MKMSPQQRAKLRVCASCEWIYESSGGCPKCDFVSYGARYVYGDKAYTYKHTQEPWMKKKINIYTYDLECEINNNTNHLYIKTYRELLFKPLECKKQKESLND